MGDHGGRNCNAPATTGRAQFFHYPVTQLNFEIVADPVPEPATLSLLGVGLAGAAVRRFRRKRT